MHDHDDLLAALANLGIDRASRVPAWTGLAELLAALDALARVGTTAVVKIDGGRDGQDVYTVVVSGGRLGDAFRRDGSDLATLLREALQFYVANA